MRKLEDFDEKFVLNESCMQNVIGSPAAQSLDFEPSL
jgi:hypothetical protein